MLRLKSCTVDKIKTFVIFAKSLSTSREDVILEKINHVGCITINRPKELNAFNLTILKNIGSKINEWNADDSVFMVLIRGAGNTAFCAGADIKSIRDHYVKGNERAALDIFKNGYLLVNEYSSLKKPFIAIINGITMGSGRFKVFCLYTALSFCIFLM
jgi:enoyl-CoA hydratase/carnithine racemase